MSRCLFPLFGFVCHEADRFFDIEACQQLLNLVATAGFLDQVGVKELGVVLERPEFVVLVLEKFADLLLVRGVPDCPC